jgi:hypothetical protein
LADRNRLADSDVLASPVTGVDFVAVPSTDWKRSRFDTGVCHMAFFSDPDGNALMLHQRYAPRD